MPKLTNDDYCREAKVLGCTPEAIKAVALVESGGRGGFDAKGRLLARYEGHVFRKQTNRRFDGSHPHLSYPYELMRSKRHGYPEFSEAFALDPHAAMMSTSYGMFQPMGFNHDEMGYESVDAMLNDFKKGEAQQLAAFVRLIAKWGLADEMRRMTRVDCVTIAKRYNGAGYASNDYHNKIYNNYQALKRTPINCGTTAEVTAANVGAVIDGMTVEPVTVGNPLQPEPVIVPEPIPVVAPQNPAPMPTETVLAPPKDGSTETATKMTIAGFAIPTFLTAIISAIQSAITNGFISAADVGAAVIGFIKENTKYIFWMIGLVILGMAAKKLWKQVTLWKQMEIASDPKKNNVEVKPQ